MPYNEVYKPEVPGAYHSRLVNEAIWKLFADYPMRK